MEPERLRFDFTHGKPIDQNQIREIEDWINSTALQSVQPVIKVRFKVDMTLANRYTNDYLTDACSCIFSLPVGIPTSEGN